MLALECKGGQIVIKWKGLGEVLGRVTLRTRLAVEFGVELPSVHVLVAVLTEFFVKALEPKHLLLIDQVAIGALDLSVLIGQRKPGLIVIKLLISRAILPSAGHMALGTAFFEELRREFVGMRADVAVFTSFGRQLFPEVTSHRGRLRRFLVQLGDMTFTAL